MWVRVLLCANLLCSAQLAVGQLSRWDSGVPKDLFKDDQTPKDPKKPKQPQKPTHRVAPAPANCPECQKIADKLQAAVDDWYALQLADAKANISGAQSGDKNAPPEKDSREQKEDAMAGLGQNERAPPQDKDKASVKKEIGTLTKDLQDCLKKCNPPAVGGGATQPVTPAPVAPGGGTGAAIKPPPKECDVTVPTLPGCFDTERDRENYRKKLEQLQILVADCRKAYTETGADIPASNPHYKAWQEVKAKADKARDDINDQNFPGDDGKDKIDKVPICPKKKTATGGGHGMAPKRVREEFCALISEEKIKVGFTGTGETCGHVADMTVSNLTNQRINCVIPPMLLKSISGKNQNYACPRSENVAVGPKESKTVPVEGVCLVRNKPPVGKNTPGDLMINDCVDDGTKIPDDKAEKLMTIAHDVFQVAEDLLKNGSLKEIPYSDPKKKKEVVVQWATWADSRISEITGVPPATKEDLKKVVYKQVEEQGPVTPEKKKKIDEGIDKIFEKVELTTAKAKDLEEKVPATEETPGGAVIEGENTPGAGQPEYIGQTRAKKPTPTPKPKPPPKPPVKPEPAKPKDGGKTVEKPPEKPAAPPTEEKPKAAAPVDPKFAKLEEDCAKKKKEVQDELDKAGTDTEKKKKAQAKLNALEKVCHEAGWASAYAQGPHDTATTPGALEYNDARGILDSIDEVPDARARLKKAGFTDAEIKDMLDQLNDTAEVTETGLPSDKRYPGVSGDLLRKKGYNPDSDGGKKADGAAKDLKQLYMAEGKYNKDAKPAKAK